MACATLPPAPPAGPPVSPPPPVPTPPPVTPPTPPAPPPGLPHVALDLANSYFSPDTYCYPDKSVKQAMADELVDAGYGGALSLLLQNTAGTVAGTINIRVTADNTLVNILPAESGTPVRIGGVYRTYVPATTPVRSDGVYTITVPAGNSVLFAFSIDASAADPGTIKITIDNGVGTASFNMVTHGPVDCTGGGG